MTKKTAVFNWSGGKDSALALYKAISSGEYNIVSLLTTINSETKLSSMHQIPLKILQDQADSIGIPLYEVMLPSKDMQGYEDAMTKAVEYFKEMGVGYFIFGDIFLDDVKKYREAQLKLYDIEVVEPLWGKSSKEVIEDFLESGLKTKIVITQADKLDASFVGRNLDQHFIESLPADVDFCGENGEYHTLAYDGPIFKTAVQFILAQPRIIHYNIKLDNGDMQTFSYWYTEILTQ